MPDLRARDHLRRPCEGGRTIAVRERTGDGVPGAVARNPFEIDAGVEGVATCVQRLSATAAQVAA